MAGSMTINTDTIRLAGEIQQGKHLILVVPSTEACDFEMQPQSSLSLQMPNCRVGEQLSIAFEPPSTQSDSDLMNDFVDWLDNPQEIPESVSGLLLIDGIRDYVRYDYKTKWENLSKDERNNRRASAYRQIRIVYRKIEPFITGDLSQQKEAEGTARAACAHLNSLIADSTRRVDFKTITLSGFNSKWRRVSLNQQPTFPEMIIQSKKSRSGQCLVSSTTPGNLFAGTYVFRRLVRVSQSLFFNFQLKASDASCLNHLPSVLLRDSSAEEDVGTTSTNDGMIRITGNIQSSKKELILSIPSSTTCVYELVQASLTLQLPTGVLDGLCRIGEQLTVIEWEEPEIDLAMLELMGPDLLQDVQDVDETVKDLTREFHEIPKSLVGISLIDGIWNYLRFNYEARWKRLSKDERMEFKYAFRRYRYVCNRLETFSTGKFSQRSDVETAARAACEYLNSGMRKPQQPVDFQTVSLITFQKKWIDFTKETKPKSAPEDPSQLPQLRRLRLQR